jgi:hypothetical protein
LWLQEEENAALENLSEDGDEDEAEEGSGGASPRSEGDGQGEDDEDEDEGARDEEELGEPVLNSYGRQALGCMFGMEAMPTMCASYPLATEHSWADFWYSRRSGAGAQGEALAAALELKYGDGAPQLPAASSQVGPRWERPSLPID